MATTWLKSWGYVTVSFANTYEDYDVSGLGSVNMTGMFFLIQNIASGSAYNVNIIPKGSTDHLPAELTAASENRGQTFWYSPVDENGIVRIYSESISNIRFFPIAYTEGEVTTFINKVNLSTGTTGSYVDVDVSSYSGDETAIAGIFIKRNTSSSGRKMFLRPKASTDDIFSDNFGYDSALDVCPLDESELCQQKIDNTAYDLYYTAFYNDDTAIECNINLVSLGALTEDTWTRILINALASGVFIIRESIPSYGDVHCGIRPSGSTTFTLRGGRPLEYMTIGGCDDDGYIDYIISEVTTLLKIRAYTIAEPSGSPHWKRLGGVPFTRHGNNQIGIRIW